MQLNEGSCVEVHGSFSIDVFQTAVDELVKRHEVLCYSFQHGENGVQILVEDAAKVPIKVLEVGCLGFEYIRNLVK